MTQRILSLQSLLDFGWLVFLILLFFYFWHKRQNIQETIFWVKTKAKVTRCEWTTRANRIWPKIEYIYQVGEQEYMGEDLFYDTSHRTSNDSYARRVAYKAARAFKEDENIEIYYNPDAPEQAALDITIPGKLNFILILIVGWIVLHIILTGVKFFR